MPWIEAEFPILLMRTRTLLPPLSGKRVRLQYLLIDGGHRLACLLARGKTILPRHVYRQVWTDRFRPDDKTWILSRRGLIPEPEYFEFLSAVYGVPQALWNRHEFLRYTQRAMPDRLDEVRSVLRVDGFGEH